MTDFLTVLRSKGPVLAKTWSAAGIKGYDRAKNFTASAVPVGSIRDVHASLIALEVSPRACVIRGRHMTWDLGDEDPPIVETERTLDDFDDIPHFWVCLDVDNFKPVLSDPVTEPAESVEEFVLSCLPHNFHGVTHHWQLSNSAGAPGNERTLKAHVWFWMDQPWTGAQLTAWARVSRVPVDITVFRTVQVHYTSAPMFSDEAGAARCPVRERSGLTRGVLGDEVDLPYPSEADVTAIDTGSAGRANMTDPGEKPGLIGAFCRLYPPARVVDEVLPHVFEYEGDNGLRLTWLQGGGSPGGACITDDELHIYNSHSSDPLEGRAANMWDVVRVHQFGELDDAWDPDALIFAGPGKTPSALAMREWASGLEDVAAEMQSVREERAAEHEAATQVDRSQRQDTAADRDARLTARLADVAACPTATELEQVLCRDIQKEDWDDGERERLVDAVQQRFKDTTGVKLPVALARKWVRPPGPAAGASAGAPDWLDEWCYVLSACEFFHLPTKVSLSHSAFDIEKGLETPMTADGVRHERASAWVTQVWGITTVDNYLYAPGQDPTFTMLGRTWANLYDPTSVPRSAKSITSGTIGMVESHLRRMFPDDRERGLLVSWMAHQVRHPGDKIRWAPYVHGPQGTGKTFIAEVMALVMGAPNVRVVAGSTLLSDFNSWSTGHALVAIEEVYQVGHRTDTEEKLKGPIANTTVDVHRKGKDAYQAPNFTNYLLLSNHPDALLIREGDRRYFFLKAALTAGEAKALSDEGYFNNLFDVCRKHVAELRHWLLDVAEVVEEFDPDGRAPETAARAEVIELSQTDNDVVLREALTGRAATTVAWATRQIRSAGDHSVRGRTVAKALRDAGFSFFRRMRTSAKGYPQQVYIREGLPAGEDLQVRAAVAYTLENSENDFPD